MQNTGGVRGDEDARSFNLSPSSRIVFALTGLRPTQDRVLNISRGWVGVVVVGKSSLYSVVSITSIATTSVSMNIFTPGENRTDMINPFNNVWGKTNSNNHTLKIGITDQF